MVSEPVLPYGRQWIDEDDVAEVAAVLRGERVTQGPMVERFEAALAMRTGARYAVAVSNGTAALHLACLAADVGPGDFGVTSPITFVASANCVAYCGGTPGFADVDVDTVTMDPDRLDEACRRRRPKVIIPVDFSGQPAALPSIRDVARRYDALVIEDAAHSLGATYEADGREVPAGACEHSDMAILSFHPVKQITTGEGGAVLTNDMSLRDRLTELRTHGIVRDRGRLLADDGPWYHEQQRLGFNYRLTDIQCALGLSQLKKLDRFVARRRELVERYRRELAHEPDVRLLIEAPGRRSSYHLMVARLRGGPDRRRRVFDGLCARGIQPQVHYIPVHLQPWYRQRYGLAPGQFPNAEEYYGSCLSLPLFPRMADTDDDRVVTALTAALAETRV
jgi:perosamine synthetase